MKTYYITVYRREELEKVKRVLEGTGIKYNTDLSTVLGYARVKFEAEKDQWKAVKKELRLKVDTMWSTIQV